MEQLIGLIIFLLVVVVGRLIEASQRKQNQERDNSRPAQKPEQSYEPPIRRPVEIQRQKTEPKHEEYNAPEEEVEEFLRNIGILPPKEEKPVHRKRKTHVRQEPAVAKSKSELSEDKDALRKKAGIQALPELEPIRSDMKGTGFVFKDMLHDKESLKTAFVLSEVLKPPLALRRDR